MRWLPSSLSWSSPLCASARSVPSGGGPVASRNGSGHRRTAPDTSLSDCTSSTASNRRAGIRRGGTWDSVLVRPALGYKAARASRPERAVRARGRGPRHPWSTDYLRRELRNGWCSRRPHVRSRNVTGVTRPHQRCSAASASGTLSPDRASNRQRCAQGGGHAHAPPRHETFEGIPPSHDPHRAAGLGKRRMA